MARGRGSAGPARSSTEPPEKSEKTEQREKPEQAEKVEQPEQSDGVVLVHLDQLLEQRGMTLTSLSEQVDLTLANLSILKNGRARAIRFSTLYAICRALDCQPGDLLSVPRDDRTDGDGGGGPARSHRRSSTSSDQPSGS